MKEDRGQNMWQVTITEDRLFIGQYFREAKNEIPEKLYGYRLSTFD